MSPTREIFWNVGNIQLMVYVLCVAALFIAIYGIFRHFRRWRLGKKERRFDQIAKRFIYFVKFVFGHERILREVYPGIIHLLIFWGIVILFIGTLTIAFQEDLIYPFFKKKILQGVFYLFYSLTLDVFGLLAILGILMTIYRRYVSKPDQLDSRLSDLFLLCLLLFILITGFCVEGLRISVSEPLWALWSPVGWSFARLLGAVGLGEVVQRDLHRALWWTHLFAGAGLVAYLPFSNLFHIISSSLNVFLQSFEPRGSLAPIDFQIDQPFGVSQITDFTWKDLLDLDACTRCGRCQENCPAFLSEKPLNPKKVILNLKASFYDLSKRSCLTALAGSVVSEDELWACTTCLACVEVCPVFIEPMGKVIDLRRHLVMEKAQFPQEMKSVFRNLEIFGDIMGEGSLLREDWALNLTINKTYQNSDIEVLFWVGCMGALYDEKSKGKTINAVKILENAGINFGILGKEETCCGDMARKIGNEHLFQELVKNNIKLFTEYGIRKIVTNCPHCFNVFRNEYPQFGMNLDVIHFSQLIKGLLEEEKLKVQSPVDGLFTYHDPCYLGRYNSIYQEPREILDAVLASNLKEMDQSKCRSFCCGAGGGNFWQGRILGKRMEELRIGEAIETGANGIITSCPFCEIMFDSEAKQKGQDGLLFEVMDIIDIVSKATCLKH